MISKEKHGPWAVIAGGSEGVGESFARKLAEAGLNLIIIARKTSALEQTAATLRKSAGVEVRTIGADLLQPGTVERIIEETRDLEVGLLAFVAAAAGEMRPFIERSLEDVMIPVQMSVIVQTALIHHYAPQMAKRRRGGIIVVSSMAGNAGTVKLSSYGGAKAYTQVLAEALWAELKPYGVDVLCLVLGSTATPGRARSSSKGSGMPVLTADEVVQHGLDMLGESPVEVPPPLAQIFRDTCALPRAPVIEEKAKMMGGAPAPQDG